MRAMILAAVLVALAGPVRGQDTSTEAYIFGVGQNTCGEFAQHYREDPALLELFYFTWAQGFLSAMNMSLSVRTDGKFLRLTTPGFGIDQQKAFLRQYCADNPLRSYHDGVAALFAELARRQPK